ncbi:MAG: hypothetical protein AAF360_01825 [Pseudomonadota bacterium]
MSSASLIEKISAWRADDANAPVAIVAGYDDDAFIEAVVQASPSGFTLLCDDKDADRAAITAGEAGRDAPKILIADRLPDDLLAARRAASMGVVAAPFRTAAAHLIREIARVQAPMARLIGEAATEDQVARKIVIELRDMIDSLAGFSGPQVLFCDPGGDFLRGPGGLADLIAPDGFDPSGAGDFAAARVEGLGDAPEDRLAAEAVFFMAHDDETLETLLRAEVATPALDSLLVEWAACLAARAGTASTAAISATFVAAAERVQRVYAGR